MMSRCKKTGEVIPHHRKSRCECGDSRNHSTDLDAWHPGGHTSYIPAQYEGFKGSIVLYESYGPANLLQLEDLLRELIARIEDTRTLVDESDYTLEEGFRMVEKQAQRVKDRLDSTR